MNRMRTKVEKMLTPLRRNGSGQGALAIVLLLLLMGAVIIVPLLVFMQTGLKAGGVYESKMREFYAADAGVEDALWWVKNAYPDLTEKFPGPPDTDYRYDPYNYEINYSYKLPDEINDINVTVNITNMWIPTPDYPDPDEARDIIEAGRLIVAGSCITLNGTTGYQVWLVYYYDTDPDSPYYDPNGTSLMVDNIGVWLSGGFHYVPGSGNLGGYPATVSSRCGGEAIVWDVDTHFADLPGGMSYPMIKVVNFQFTGPSKQYPSALSWVETSGVSDLTFSWDADTRFYRIISVAGDTVAEAYTIKIEIRKMGAAIAGDYHAAGNTLMASTSGVGTAYRDRLYMETSAIITDDDIIPAATVDAAFLYWSGWIDHHYCKSGRWPRWQEIPELKYPDNPTMENLTILVEESAKVNNVTFGIEGNMTEVIADEWQADENVEHEGTWSYSCYADVTDLVKGFIHAEEIEANGAGTYTLGHAVVEARPGYPEYSFELYPEGEETGYPLGVPATGCGWGGSSPRHDWCYAGWSLIIVYSSSETRGHQLYLYDNFAYAEEHSNVDFDDDGNPGGNITGFLAPATITEEEYAAHLTCFVGEGDDNYKNDNIELNGVQLFNDESPANNVWNEKSPGVSIEGIDIDTFIVEYPTIEPADTSARVDLPTKVDSWNLVYIILSFRSEIITGGTINYLIR